jgi:coiled-coil domain-containing protein 55
MDDSDEENGSNVVSEVARVNAQLARRQQADQAALQAAAADDPSIYDYDGEYDKFKSAEVKTHQLSQASTSKDPPVSRVATPPRLLLLTFCTIYCWCCLQKSKYVGNLLSTAKMREKEKDRIYERKLLKEREVEDKEFGDKPKFLTTAYKKKMQEDQKWEYENKYVELRVQAVVVFCAHCRLCSACFLCAIIHH